MQEVQSGHQAPPFSLRTTNGQRVSLLEVLSRGPVVAAFFKISCPVCQFTFPFLERLHRAYGGRGATFLGVSQDDADATRDFCAEYAISFPCVTDEDGYPVSNQYGLSIVPSVYLIAPDGKVLLQSVGFVKDDLEKISTELAVRLKQQEAPLFLPDEIIPDYKPG